LAENRRQYTCSLVHGKTFLKQVYVAFPTRFSLDGFGDEPVCWLPELGLAQVNEI
jgi:hypothetical protein